MKITIRDAEVDVLNQINHLLGLSKSYWGYDKNFIDHFMNKLGITHTYMERHDIKMFYVDDTLAGFFNFGFK